MTHYGIIFQQYRKNKNLSLVKAAGNIVTPQYLGRFEKGESDISFIILEQLLNRMHVTIEEFIYESKTISNSFSISEMIDTIDTIIIYKDKALLDKLLKNVANPEKNQSLYNNHFIIILKRIDNLLFQANHHLENEVIFNYLEHTESWGKYEFFLATYSLPALTNEQLSLYVHHAFSKNKLNEVVYDYGIDFILQCCVNLLKRGEINLTKTLIAYFNAKQTLNSTLQNLKFHLYLNFIEGCILMMENNVTGLEKCRKIITFFEEEVCYEEYASYLEELLTTLTDQ